jgi:hypothetical protein
LLRNFNIALARSRANDHGSTVFPLLENLSERMKMSSKRMERMGTMHVFGSVILRTLFA